MLQGSHHLEQVPGHLTPGSGTDLSTCSGSRGLTQEWMARHRAPQGTEQEFYSMKLPGIPALPLPAHVMEQDKHWSRNQEQNSRRGRTIQGLEYSPQV